MKKTCVILNFHYPYMTDENFIHLELPFLQEEFDRIIIVPTEILKNQKKIYQLPREIECYPMGAADKNLLMKDAFELIASREICYIKYGKYNKSDFIFLLKAFEVKKKLISLNLDGEIYLYNFWCDYPVLGAIMYAQKNEKLVRVITRMHGYDLYEYRNSQKYLPFRKYIMEKINLVFPCSEDGKEYLVKKYGHSDKIITSYLGTYRPFFEQKSNKKYKKFHIITCSNLVQIKRLDKLIDALQILDKAGEKNIIWTCIGDGELKTSLFEAASKNLKNIEFEFKGQMNNADVLKYYLEYLPDLFVNTSDSEGIPVSIMEAMSCRIPVIAPDVGGIREIIDDGINGILLNCEFDSKELVHAIMQIKDNINIEEMRQYAYEKWDCNFNAKNNYQRFIQTFINC